MASTACGFWLVMDEPSNSRSNAGPGPLLSEGMKELLRALFGRREIVGDRGRE